MKICFSLPSCIAKLDEWGGRDIYPLNVIRILCSNLSSKEYTKFILIQNELMNLYYFQNPVTGFLK